MKPGLYIRVLQFPDDDGLFQFETTLSNGEHTSSLAYWEYADHLQLSGKQLCDFPQSSADKVSYELGGPNKGDFRWAYQMKWEVCCYDTAGHAAIKILIDNRLEEPEHAYCTFSILADPGSINTLGKKLSSWDPSADGCFEWQAGE